jgi:DNA mismatch repair protein MutH
MLYYRIIQKLNSLSLTATRTKMAQTIAEVHAKLLPLVGISHSVPLERNKGRPGQYLETLLGIPHTSNCLDCSDGEVKTFPLKRLKDGTLVAKETVAVTMLNTEELRTNDFASSKCCKKMNKMMVVPYLREETTIRFFTPTIIDKAAEEFIPFYTQAETDYNAIRQGFLESGILSSSTGTFIQNRTKGAGHGSTSRAFYMKKEFLSTCVPTSL